MCQRGQPNNRQQKPMATEEHLIYFSINRPFVYVLVHLKIHDTAEKHSNLLSSSYKSSLQDKALV